MDHPEGAYERANREAREYATRLHGEEPMVSPVQKGIEAFAFSAVVPWLGLTLFGVPMAIAGAALAVTGSVCGFSVWWYHKHRRDMWFAAWRQRLVEMSSNTDKKARN
jgi:hypothetical protein